MISHLIIYCVTTALWCFIVASPSYQVIVASAFQPRIPRSVAVRAFAHKETTIFSQYGASVALLKLRLIPEMNDSVQLAMPIVTPSTSLHQILLPASSSSILMIADENVAEWRQYVPLIVSVGVILDILLGSPLANLALGPMKRASEKGAGGRGDSRNSCTNEESSDMGGGGRSLFSAFSGNNNNNMDSGRLNSSRGKERVDSEAIAQAALNKALNTLELKRFLEENKTDEQRYEEVRRKINKQMEELDDGEA